MTHTHDLHTRDLEPVIARLNDLPADALRAELAEFHPADLGQLLAELPASDAARWLSLLPRQDQADAFGYLPLECQAAVAESLDRNALIGIVGAMSHDERADLYNLLPEDRRERLLPALAQAEREDIRKLAAYAEGTVGAVMTSDYATLSAQMTAAEAIDALRRAAPDRETIYDAYVIDAARRLIGVVSLRDLILAPADARLEQFMTTEVIFARAEEPQEEAARRIARYDLRALPVINGGDMLAGIVTQDDAMDVAEEEATEDFHKVGASTRLLGGLRRAGVMALYRARIPWLVVLVFGNLFSGAAIAAYEDTIAAYISLVFFLPLLIDSGGNAGSQSATLMVRALATGDVRLRDWSSMLGREVMIAAMLGATMALAVSTIGYVRAGPDVALVVSLSMVIIVIVGSLIGMTLPFILTRLKLDPATASAPLITSIADATGVLIYFAMATSLLPGLIEAG
ncbi:MAG: magnesium transporter [Brevundimonas sp.]|uniref:magnesium transporter n=1 Tax=Brevundimonas sp. TaxID=1871086 RepID=UPI00391B0526